MLSKKEMEDALCASINDTNITFDVGIPVLCIRSEDREIYVSERFLSTFTNKKDLVDWWIHEVRRKK